MGGSQQGVMPQCFREARGQRGNWGGGRYGHSGMSCKGWGGVVERNGHYSGEMGRSWVEGSRTGTGEGAGLDFKSSGHMAVGPGDW